MTTINGIVYTFNNLEATVTGYTGNEISIIIPSEIQHNGVDYQVVSIGDNAFLNNTNLKSVIIPDSVTIIGEAAFLRTGLTSIIIPNSVTTIGVASFLQCYDLTSVTIVNGDNPVSIGKSAFQQTGLKSISIPKSVTTIGGESFSHCYDLTSVTIAEGGASSIGESAFEGCTSLTKVTIPKSVISIVRYAFYYCIKLKSITIPEFVNSIGDNAFNTVEYAYIQGNDANYSSMTFGTSLKAVFCDENSTIKLNNNYPQTLRFNSEPEISAYSNEITISPVFETNPITLTGTYLNQEPKMSTYVDVYSFKVEEVSGDFTIGIDTIILVKKTPTIMYGSSNTSLRKKKNKIQTKTELKRVESLLPNYPDEFIYIDKIDSTLFTSSSQDYNIIETIVGYSSNLDEAKLEEISKFDKKTLMLLATGERPIFVGDKELTFDGMNTRIFGEILPLGGTFVIYNKYKATLVVNGSSGITIEKIETSPICFPAGTPILTDQGYIPIDLITTQTLHNKPIQLTKTISTDKYLVCFEKDSLEKNVPFQRTIISKDHMVYYKDFSLKAKDMIPYFDGVYKIKYKGEVLYNVLLDIHGKMKVNNITCETLDPKHKMAKLYNRTTKEREDMIVVWKEEKKERTQMKFK